MKRYIETQLDSVLFYLWEVLSVGDTTYMDCLSVGSQSSLICRRRHPCTLLILDLNLDLHELYLSFTVLMVLALICNFAITHMSLSWIRIESVWRCSNEHTNDLKKCLQSCQVTEGCTNLDSTENWSCVLVKKTESHCQVHDPLKPASQISSCSTIVPPLLWHLTIIVESLVCQQMNSSRLVNFHWIVSISHTSDYLRDVTLTFIILELTRLWKWSTESWTFWTSSPGASLCLTCRFLSSWFAGGKANYFVFIQSISTAQRWHSPAAIISGLTEMSPSKLDLNWS